MASTYISSSDAEKILLELEKAYRNFYQNSDEFLLLVNERTKAKTHGFYEQLSKDSKNLIDSSGFSSSWIWSLFFEEETKNRKFYNPYLRIFERLVVFYQDHIFNKDDDPKQAVHQKTNTSNKQGSLNLVGKNSTITLQNSNLSSSQEVAPVKKRTRRNRFAIAITSIAGLLIVVFVVLNNLGTKVAGTIDHAFKDVFKGQFDPDPARKGLGFASIHIGNNPKNKANLFNSLDCPELKTDEEFIFTVFTDFHNIGNVNIEDPKVKISLSKDQENNRLIINSELSASNAKSLNDIVIVEKLPPIFKLELIRLNKNNYHGETDPKECNGYLYSVELDLNMVNTGVDLDVLDTKYNGWCDQGYVAAVYRITL